MKTNYFYLFLLIVIGLSSCLHSDDMIEPHTEKAIAVTENRIVKQRLINKSQLKEKQLTVTESPITLDTTIGPIQQKTTITLKYKPGIPERTKLMIRSASYLFTIDQISQTICTDVEVWFVTLPSNAYIFDIQNGYTQGNYQTDNDSFDLTSFVDRIELNWRGDCREFQLTPLPTP